MSNSTRRPTFSPEKHPAFAGKSVARDTTPEHRIHAVASPAKPSQVPAWKQPNHSNYTDPPKRSTPGPETSSDSGYRTDSFDEPATTTGPGIHKHKEAGSVPISGLGD